MRNLQRLLVASAFALQPADAQKCAVIAMLAGSSGSSSQRKIRTRCNMTREEAITYGERKKARIQEKLCRDGSSYGDHSIYYSEMEFTSAAVAALREQEERERGCEYCNDGKSIYHRSSEIHNSMDEDVYISGSSLAVDIGCHSYGQVEINFCPMCGRRLYLPKPTTAEANN